MTLMPSEHEREGTRAAALPCGIISDRDRLRLPDCYVPGQLAESVSQALCALRGGTTQLLLDTLACRESSLAQRIASGTLLSWLGDPRIRSQHPEMRDVPGGIAEIGLAPDEVDAVLERCSGLALQRQWVEKECPRHRVTLTAFRIARFPVTNAEYRDFLVATGHPELPSSWPFRQFPCERANHPVYTVSAACADAYAAWLARRTGRGFRLPTEAEWEWAAGGSGASEFPWGESFDAELANTAETGLFNTSPVGAFVGGESAFGVADMAGNVEEYVADDYAPYPGGSYIFDHLAQIHGTYRIARGGCFARWRDLARTRRRHGQNSGSATYAMGFRLAETV